MVNGPLVLFLLLPLVALPVEYSAQHHGTHPRGPAPGSPIAAEVEPNGNRTPAGSLRHGVLSLALRAAAGTWRPSGDGGRAFTVAAFGEVGGSLAAPGPLIRVPQGTHIVASIRNDLPDNLRIHGFCDRSTGACVPIDVAPGETREVRFGSGSAGTYHYWATTTGMPQQFRGAGDTQLSGAFIVDDAHRQAAAADRVLVITEWTSLTTSQLHDIARQDDPGAAFIRLRPDVFFSMNGRIWPHTERLRYRLSDVVRWRVINLSTQVHPMHLHGFYFDVDSVGNGVVDRSFDEENRPRVVTQVMAPGGTMSMTWTPERAGNWLFHCHVMTHVSPTLHVDGSIKSHESHGAGGAHDGGGMTGMVLGVTVEGPDTLESWNEAGRPRRLTLEMEAEARRFGTEPALGFRQTGTPGGGPPAALPVPGPVLVLTRGEPVEITLVNRLSEGTSIHWHGMELESYYDGVHGWGRTGQRVTPMIEPGGAFVVRFTPPRAGTFMYHTHLHDRRQLTSGLYGAMIVLEPGETFDERTDHVLVVGRGGPQTDAPVVINNDRAPRLVWAAGVRHRIRLINITPDDIVSFSLQNADGPATWMPLTKDGAPVPASTRTAGAARQVIGVGETYDFEYVAPKGRQTLWLEGRTPGGRWLIQAHIIVK